MTLYLNTVVKDADAPPKLFLKPQEFRIYDLKKFFKVGAGLVLLFVFLVLLILVKKLLAKRKKRISIQPFREAEEKLKQTLEAIKNSLETQKEITRPQIAQLFIEFKVYLGRLIQQKAPEIKIGLYEAQTAEELKKLLKKIDCVRIDKEIIKEILTLLNKIVYGQLNRTEVEVLIGKMEEYLS